ncbi:MAG: hypothetical protein HUK26_09310, partial [Duodenibacillus sp.]|nr:hypothetical protein [Duodenibacillus sp.]
MTIATNRTLREELLKQVAEAELWLAKYGPDFVVPSDVVLVADDYEEE